MKRQAGDECHWSVNSRSQAGLSLLRLDAGMRHFLKRCRMLVRQRCAGLEQRLVLLLQHTFLLRPIAFRFLGSRQREKEFQKVYRFRALPGICSCLRLLFYALHQCGRLSACAQRYFLHLLALLTHVLHIGDQSLTIHAPALCDLSHLLEHVSQIVV